MLNNSGTVLNFRANAVKGNIVQTHRVIGDVWNRFRSQEEKVLDAVLDVPPFTNIDWIKIALLFFTPMLTILYNFTKRKSRLS